MFPLPRLLPSLPTPPSPAFGLARVALPTLRVCTHSLMLIRLNAQEPSRGRDDEARRARLAEKITADHEEGEPATGVVTDNLVGK